MMRRSCHESFVALFGVGLGIAALACSNPIEPDRREVTTTTRTSAVTATGAPASTTLTPPAPTAQRPTDFGFPPGTPLPQSIAHAVAVPASQHAGHFQNKVISKPAPVGAALPPPAPPAAYIAKQQEYVRQWKDLMPTIANLPPEEQEARRGALKTSIVGQ